MADPTARIALADLNRQLQDLIDARAALDRHVDRLTRLHRLSNVLVSAPQDCGIADLFAEAIPGILDVEIGAIWMLPPVDELVPPPFAVAGVAAPEGWSAVGLRLSRRMAGRGVVVLSADERALLPGVALRDAVACTAQIDGAPKALLLGGNIERGDRATNGHPDHAPMMALVAEMCASHIDHRIDRQLIERQLASVRESRTQLALVLGGTNDGWWDWDIRQDVCYVSPRWLQLLGADPARSASRQPFWIERVHDDDAERFRIELGRALQAEDGRLSIEVRLRRDDGRFLPVLVRGQLVRDPDGLAERFSGAILDLTAQRKAQDTLAASEASLRASLAEKDALLKEVHHRVKNNLQIINSFIRLERGRQSGSDVRAVLHEMQGRVLSMALLHEALYRTSNFASVDLAPYLTQLSGQLMRSMSTLGRVVLRCDLEPTVITLDQAVPCGLLVNELLTNALKHAFPDDRTGEIRLRLTTEGETAELSVADDGVGLPDDWRERQAHSLGMQLAWDLARQVHGELTVEPGAGTRLVLRFTPLRDSRRHTP